VSLWRASFDRMSWHRLLLQMPQLPLTFSHNVAAAVVVVAVVVTVVVDVTAVTPSIFEIKYFIFIL
jgi:hypothetical protein